MQNRTKNNLSEIPGKAAIWSDEDGLSWLTFEPGADITGEDAVQLLELAKKTHVESEYFRVIIDLRTNPQITTAARNYAANATPQFISAFAILTGGLTMKIIADFFVQFHKPGQPTKIFTNEEEARRWLLKQKERK